MKLSHFPALASLAIAGCALTLAASAESRVTFDLNLRLGPPPPVVVLQAPPAPIVERMTLAPAQGYVWIAGHNSWINGRWVWIGGAWARPPQPGAFYVEGRWDARSHNWVECHWEFGAPPPPRHEIVLTRPSPRHVWIDGYWVWHGRHQEWVAGHWEVPPRGRHNWEASRWELRGNTYVFIDGRWR